MNTLTKKRIRKALKPRRVLATHALKATPRTASSLLSELVREPGERHIGTHSPDVGEMFGEAWVETVTSGQDSYLEDLNEVTTEELGGPFVDDSSADETDAVKEELVKLNAPT